MLEDLDKITYFATTNSRGQETPFGIKKRDRERHMYVIGKTGMGKSTLLENLAIQDIRNGEGMAFIDPHGSSADRIMEYVPEHRIKDVVYFAPFDMEHPVAFNVMEDVGYDKRHLVVSGLLSAFRKIWVDAWSARMEYILSNVLLALLEYEGATLLDVNRMLINKTFRKKVVEHVTDPIVKSFWVEEFANYTDRYTQDATPAIQNKVGQFTSNPLIRNIVGQPKSSFDLRKMMDERKIMIINLSKGRVGEVNATLLGSMLVTKIYLAAMSRADVPAATLTALPRFYFYVDEFQSFANLTFADILSEARKYKLNLIIAHQYIEQMEEEVRDAVFGNVGTTIAFRVGPFDAEVLETIYSPVFLATDLVNLGFAQIYLTLMINGVGSPPFSATTLPPFDAPPHNFTEQTLANSRKVYGRHRAEVEESIKQWQESDPYTPEPPKKKDYSKSASSAQRPAPVVLPPKPREEPRVASTPPTPPVPPPRGFAPEMVTPLPGITVPPAPAETRRAEAKSVGAQVGHQHAMASSKGNSAPRPPASVAAPAKPRPAPYVPPKAPERPPLGGAKSLREALEQATGKPARPPHSPDLREVLHTVAPKAEEVVQPDKNTSGLPESTLRSMLSVDEIDTSES